jgi:hypothetical protein
MHIYWGKGQFGPVDAAKYQFYNDETEAKREADGRLLQISRGSWMESLTNGKKRSFI